MKVFLDTSVLIAAFYQVHEHHHKSLEVLLRFSKPEAGCSAHSLVEVYSRVTSMPGEMRVPAHEALLFIEDLRARLTLINLEAEEYSAMLSSAAERNVFGGAIYDCLHAECAIKAKAEALYTWNVRDFERVAAPALRVLRPTELRD